MSAVTPAPGGALALQQGYLYMTIMALRILAALALALAALSPAAGQPRASFTELPAIPTPDKTADSLKRAWGNGNIPASNAPDVVGAFRLICAPSHLNYDDPLLYPGQVGASHLHQWFGNSGGDAHSDYASLRTSGESTCGTLNRSAYWAPALIHDGKVVVPDYATVYYKRRPASDRLCADTPAHCIGIPRGLRYVFGRTMAGGKYPGWSKDSVRFVCDGIRMDATPNLPEAIAACPAGARLGVQLAAPDCWNGRDLDSPDHRAHMAMPVGDRNTGRQVCPASHPFRIPDFTFVIWYQVGDGLDGAYFSSDRMPGMAEMPAGSTVHADWFGAWDDDVMRRWIAGCIDGFRNCSGGDLGDGGQLIGASQPSYGWSNPNPRVPIPPRP